MKNRAFTLIELLVVIAIIAILAAILFPVFAQAKAAAKKTTDLSQFKQVGTAIQIYTSDHDDVLPLAYAVSPRNRWYYNAHIETPADWPTGETEEYYEENRSFWVNSTYAYVKNGDIFRSNAGVTRTFTGVDYSNPANKKYFTTNLQYNGTLNGWSNTAINQPSQLPLLSQNRGTQNLQGFGSSSPRLICRSLGPCTFVPSSPTCDGSNGTWSELWYHEDYTQWVHGRGQITVHADTSARWRSMNGPTLGPSDFRTMYWSRFNSGGFTITEWQDTNFCHTMLFQPDFDFANFGSPVEY